MQLDFTQGAPGSHFTLTGADFAPTSAISLTVNGIALGVAQANSSGEFTVTVTTEHADLGSYSIIDQQGVGVAANFTLAADAPLHMPPAFEPHIALPAGIAYTQFVYLPLIN